MGVAGNDQFDGVLLLRLQTLMLTDVPSLGPPYFPLQFHPLTLADEDSRFQRLLAPSVTRFMSEPNHRCRNNPPAGFEYALTDFANE